MDSGYAPPIASAGPRTIICYICGRQYGVHSYDIHLKQCKELWVARESQKPKRERRPLPEDPMLGRSPAAAGGAAGTAAADSAAAALQRGSPSGKGAQMSSADIAAMNAAAQDTYNNVSLLKCEWCGRSFLAEKLEIHNRSCTQDNPARRVTDSVKRGNSINSRELSSAPPERPKTTSNAGRDARQIQRQDERLGSTSLPTASAPTRGSPLVEVSPLTSKRGVTRIEPVPADLIQSEDEYSDAYKGKQLGSPMRGPSGRSLRHKRPSPVKGGMDAESVDESNGMQSEAEGLARVDSMERTRAISTGNKAETIRYLSQRVDEIEQHAISLVQSVGEIKALIRQLQH